MATKLARISSSRRDAYLAERVEMFAERCRQHGLAVTPQRRAIMRALLSSDAHPCAEEVYEAVTAEHPTISLATVHRTLETLCQIGEARKVTPLHQSARYDGNVLAHHHLVCVGCHQIVDVEAPAFDDLLAGHRRFGEFEVLGCSVEIHVRCASCKQASK
jgi:Fur family transcriptional regulator, peroxide stress response regulator